MLFVVTHRNYFFMKRQPNSGGFTLVEMIVVVAVIGILASIVYANFGAARAAARDDIRKADIKSLQLAIEFYKAQNGRYPAQGCGNNMGMGMPHWAGSESSYNPSIVASCPGTYIVGLVPDFIGALPREPGSNKVGTGYVYTTNLSGSAYKLLSHHNVEVKLITVNDAEFARKPSTCAGFNPIPTDEQDVYAVYSVGGECW